MPDDSQECPFDCTVRGKVDEMHEILVGFRVIVRVVTKVATVVGAVVVVLAAAVGMLSSLGVF